MKKLLKYFWLIGVISLFMTPANVLSLDNLSSLQQPSGFRGIDWGSSKDNHSYLFAMFDNVDGFEVYNRECEKQTLGAAKLSEVTYHFYHDKFYQVSITLNSDSDHQPLLDALIEAYGAPEKEPDLYIWGNDTVVIRLSPEGVSISYLPILNEINQKHNNA